MTVTTQVKGRWLAPDLAGGCPQHASWRANPQFALVPSRAASFTVTLLQPPSRSMAAIGVLVLRGTAGELVAPLQASHLAGKSRYKASAEQTVELQLEGERSYVVLPTTFAPGTEGDFTIEVSSEAEFTLETHAATAAALGSADSAATSATTSSPEPRAPLAPQRTAAPLAAADGKWVEMGEGAAAAAATAAAADDDTDDAQLPGRFVEVEDVGHKVFQAAGCGRAHELQRLLDEKRSDVNDADCDGSTALMAASGEGHTACVRLLLSSGAAAAQPNANGGTALHHACYRGQHECARLLLEAAPELAGAAERSGCTPLHAAAIQGHEACLRLLLGRGADPSRRLDGRTAAQWAEMRRHPRCTQLLEEAVASAAGGAGTAE